MFFIPLFPPAQVRKGFVLLGLSSPPVGKYLVKCTLQASSPDGTNGTSGSVTLETGQNSLLTVVDSYKVEVQGVTLEQEEKGRRVRINATGVSKETSSLACFYRKATTLEGGLLRDTTVSKPAGGDLSSVDCGTFDPMGGGVFQFGLVLVASSNAVR